MQTPIARLAAPLTLSLLSCVCIPAFADSASPPALANTPLTGARDVLRQTAEEETKAPPAEKDAEKIFRNDLAEFGKISASLTRGEAARRWLTLADRYPKLPKNPEAVAKESAVSFSEVIAIFDLQSPSNSQKQPMYYY